MPVPLPLAEPQAKPLVPCTECAKCCTYVAVGINAPTKPRYATDILWYLYHEKVSVYKDGDGEWCVMFEARCRNLQDDLLCRVYAERPHICRAFDNTSCDVNSTEGEAITFRDPAHFLDWLKTKRPRVFRQLEKRYVPAALAPARRP
jgi:Fe-S-cluster containining protein